MPAAEPVPEISWPAVVSVRPAAELEAELVARLEREGPERALGVTDLLGLRRAYYRLVGPPVPIPPGRQVRLQQGRALHRLLGTRLADEGVLEARVRRDGFVGRIDILADVPVEVKSATQLVDPTHLTTERPDHIEQLGMYCALLDRPVGRLLTLTTRSEVAPEVQAVDISFRSPPEILAEMRRRAELLRTAWRDRSADRLPRCPWFGRGCEFADAKVCSCTGQEESVGDSISGNFSGSVERADVQDRVRTALSGPVPSSGVAPIERFREILYPRRAYFTRVAPVPEAGPPESVTPAPSARPEKDLYARLSEALESGPPGEVARLAPRSTEPEEEVVGFRGRPVLLRTSRAWARYRSDELVGRAPQYALELGLRCAASGCDSGWVVIGYDRAENDRDRVQVLETRFDSVTPFSRLFRERRSALLRAIESRAPATLPACPEWMASDCPYRSECGCGAAPRSTR